jgi:hypothetical protein
MSVEKEVTDPVLMKGLKFLGRIRHSQHEMPLDNLYTFLLVVLYPGRSVEELAKLAGVEDTVMSRYLRDIGPAQGHRGPGLGLIDLTKDKQTYVLKPIGGWLAQQLREILE